MTRAPLLVVGVGNPSRGDDALGPLLVERLGAALADRIAAGALEVMTDFQLQVEHALDLEGRARVVFADASASALPPFELWPVSPDAAALGRGSHALGPGAVAEVYRRVVGAPPECWVLAVRGSSFELGAPLSRVAEAHLEAAALHLQAWAFPPTAPVGRRYELEGVVQGVGARPWAHRLARAHDLRGAVRNTTRGLTIEAFGSATRLAAFLEALQRTVPAGARVDRVAISALAGAGPDDLRIEESRADAPPRLALRPDVAICEACLADVAAPGRHHRYAHTSCASCGPRFGILERLPWDRAHTTLARFPLCDACRAAYASPDDRRFHAQGIGCLRCGPGLWLATPDGVRREADDPIAVLAAELGDGAIAAVEGIGAFHLVCDATDAVAVERLREKKHRETRPFAVMARDLAAARALAVLDAGAEAALCSPERPIVLAPSRGALPAAVSGASRRIGVLLPYTALHHRLLALAGRPLVATSGNESGEPVVVTHADAVASLGPMVDALLLHDRGITRRVEDSVVAASPGGVRTIRRARGYAPATTRLRVPARAPILAVGGHLKTTVTVVVDDTAFVGPHLGDLESVEAEERYVEELESFERLLGVRCTVVAHDLHPDYATTRYAKERGAERLVGVQHHAAHVLSALAETGLDEPVVGVVYDGSGWGPDGTLWGGEILVVDGARWTRLASVRPLPLPGGERAIRAPWRAALGALCDALGPDEALAVAARLPLFATIAAGDRATVVRMIAEGVRTPRARGVGRYFDAVAALALDLTRAGHEGHAAVALEEACEGEAAPYPFVAPAELAEGPALDARHELDLRMAVRAVAGDRLAGIAPAKIAARFHATLVTATAEVAERALVATGARRVVFSGGVMQNERLYAGLRARLGEGRVVCPRHLPVNDGGLSLGQAWAAVLAMAEGGGAGG